MKAKTKITKGMIFAGCSFTWGQGLYYYSNLSTLKEPKPHHYDADLVRFTHYQYAQSLRFPRLVANHFNTFEMCQPFNGGATYSIIEHWNSCFENVSDRDKSINADRNRPYYDYEDFSHIIYQCTQWTRSHSPAIIRPNKDGVITRSSHIESMLCPDFNNWLTENNLTLEQYIDNGLKRDIEEIKQFLQNFENHGVKAYILSWPFDIVPYIESDPWLKERFITFQYNGHHYTSMERMMDTQDKISVMHPELTIYRDAENFEIPPVDHHPSVTCHRVVADNIIRHIEQNE